MISKAKARKLVNTAKVSLNGLYDTLQEIIKTEAWTPLGYGSFTHMYEEEFSGMPLAAEMKAPILYAMIEDGASDFDISKAVPGVGPAKIESARRQQRNGIPADKAYLSPVRAHLRGPKTQFWARAEITEEQHKGLDAIAKHYDAKEADCVREAIDLYIQTYRVEGMA